MYFRGASAASEAEEESAVVFGGGGPARCKRLAAWVHRVGIVGGDGGTKKAWAVVVKKAAAAAASSRSTGMGPGPVAGALCRRGGMAGLASFLRVRSDRGFERRVNKRLNACF